MSLEDHWYRRDWVSRLLVPVSWVYGALVRLRIGLYRVGVLRSERLPVPVVVVGNLTVGGTGKTPLVIKLAQEFQARGFRPGIVSRGYGGEASEWPQMVESGSDPSLVGDEPVLMARRTHCPLVVGPDRPAAARALLTHHDCDLLLSDDGLQHYALARDLELLVVDGERGFGNGYCLPAGPLREPLSRAARVDLTLVNGTLLNGIGPLGQPSFRLEGREMICLQQAQRRETLESWAGRTVHAVAAIGNPQRFFRLLEQAGISVIAHAFPDHHKFHLEELDFGDPLAVLMTEKDAVKCSTWARENFWYLPVDAQLDPEIVRQLVAKVKAVGKGEFAHEFGSHRSTRLVNSLT